MMLTMDFSTSAVLNLSEPPMELIREEISRGV